MNAVACDWRGVACAGWGAATAPNLAAMPSPSLRVLSMACLYESLRLSVLPLPRGLSYWESQIGGAGAGG